MATEDTADRDPRHRWRPGVLAELERFGLRPRPATDPGRVRDLLKTLYTHEIRLAKLRRHEIERVLGPQPLDDYRREVHELKARYPLLGLPLELWVDEPGGAGS
jgi:hypothetical protein